MNTITQPHYYPDNDGTWLVTGIAYDKKFVIEGRSREHCQQLYTEHVRSQHILTMQRRLRRALLLKKIGRATKVAA